MKTTFMGDGVRIKKYSLVMIDGEESYQETPEWKNYKKLLQTVASLEASDIPSHVATLGFDSYVGEDTSNILKLQKYISDFEKFKAVHLYLWSYLNGTQKTTTASILGKELIQQGYSVRFVLMNTLARLLSERSFNEASVPLLESYLNCDFLILDDVFDKKKATIYKSGFQIPFLDEFLRTRLEIKRKATCFTSNIPVDEIDQTIFGVSIKTLIKRSVIPLEFTTQYCQVDDFNPEDLWGDLT